MKYSDKILSAIAAYNAARAACLKMEIELEASYEARNAEHAAQLAAAQIAYDAFVVAYATAHQAEYLLSGNGEQACAEAALNTSVIEASAADYAARAVMDKADAANNELSKRVWLLGSARADASAALDAALRAEVPADASVDAALDFVGDAYAELERLYKLNPQSHAMAVALTDAANAEAEAEAEARRWAAARVVERGEYSRRLAAGELPT